MPDFAERYVLGQFDRASLDIAWGAAQSALSRYRQSHGIIDAFPRLDSAGVNREGWGAISLLALRPGAAPVAPAVFVDIFNAINAALQQNRSTMTKPIPKTLGEIELELATIENRMRKRMTTNRQLDERTRLLSAAATKLRYPQEPNVSTIRFEKQFTPGGKVYIYAAQRTPAGYWFATGQGHPASGRSWRVLVDFIREDNVLAQPQRDLFEPLHGAALPF